MVYYNREFYLKSLGGLGVYWNVGVYYNKYGTEAEL